MYLPPLVHALLFIDFYALSKSMKTLKPKDSHLFFDMPCKAFLKIGFLSPLAIRNPQNDQLPYLRVVSLKQLLASCPITQFTTLYGRV